MSGNFSSTVVSPEDAFGCLIIYIEIQRGFLDFNPIENYHLYQLMSFLVRNNLVTGQQGSIFLLADSFRVKWYFVSRGRWLINLISMSWWSPIFTLLIFQALFSFIFKIFIVHLRRINDSGIKCGNAMCCRWLRFNVQMSMMKSSLLLKLSDFILTLGLQICMLLTLLARS